MNYVEQGMILLLPGVRLLLMYTKVMSETLSRYHKCIFTIETIVPGFGSSHCRVRQCCWNLALAVSEQCCCFNGFCSLVVLPLSETQAGSSRHRLPLYTTKNVGVQTMIEKH
uniref:Secreted protein n=1 Tax=Mus musculus TaxID=10090 RepID=Q8C6R6_MOUSE|nr:unnamed protein product [Mus musculus]BAE32278.1 unnamed protein product [Mus musculus]